MYSIKRKVGKVMIKSLSVQSHDVSFPPLVLRVAGGALNIPG